MSDRALALRCPSVVALPLLALVLAPAATQADSPLSSTDFAASYRDLAVVRDVRTSRELDADALRLLTGPGRTDRKAAVVNALGWGGDAAARARPFVDAVAAARHVSADELRLDDLTASDRFVLGYLLAMGKRPGPLRPGATGLPGARPQELLDQAAVALPNDFTVQYVRALVQAQDAMSQSWCSVYMATRQVLDRFPPPRRNMRAAAVTAAQGYIDAYKKDCGEAPTRAQPAGAPSRLGPEANQIYALDRLGKAVAAATQWGAVVWDPTRPAPVSSRREELCTSVVVWRDAAWFGCAARVWRWDGTAWTSYLYDPSRDAHQYKVVADPRGTLLAFRGPRPQGYDAATNAFRPAGRDLPADPDDVLIRANGDLWWIDFLKAVHGPHATFPIRSSSYPGRDPRHLVEDARGGLWVVDFESGLFRLGDTGGFVHEPGLDDKGSGVAVDAERGRTWLLHYTKGLVLKVDDAPPHPFDLSDLEYMRDLMLDPDGSVWVAGWNSSIFGTLRRAGSATS